MAAAVDGPSPGRARGAAWPLWTGHRLALPRVLTATGQPIPGLYAVGCDQANVMAGFYPAGGINLGPAMTFGYIAGRDLARCHDVRTGEPDAVAKVGPE